MSMVSWSYIKAEITFQVKRAGRIATAKMILMRKTCKSKKKYIL